MKDDISWMANVFLKEIIMSALVLIATILYFVGDIGGRFVLFIIITIYAANELANRINERYKDDN